MNFTAFDLVRMTHEVERVSVSKIPNEQKTLVLQELHNAVPETVFCASGLATRDYVIQQIEGALNGCAKNTKSQVTDKEGTRASPTESTETELLRHTNEDTRRKGVEAAVVIKAPTKRRATKRST